MKARFALVACLALAQIPAYGAFDTFIWFKGKDGIAGTNADKSFTLISYSFPGASEAQVHGGVSKLEHQPIVISKTLDTASPKLMQACASGKHFDSVVLTIYKTANGKRSIESTVTLTNALIAKDSRVTISGHNYEQIQLTYQKITWTWTDGGKTFNDDWLAK